MDPFELDVLNVLEVLDLDVRQNVRLIEVDRQTVDRRGFRSAESVMIVAVLHVVQTDLVPVKAQREHGERRTVDWDIDTRHPQLAQLGMSREENGGHVKPAKLRDGKPADIGHARNGIVDTYDGHGRLIAHRITTAAAFEYDAPDGASEQRMFSEAQ